MIVGVFIRPTVFGLHAHTRVRAIIVGVALLAFRASPGDSVAGA